MSQVSVVHVFYDVFMGWNHASLLEVMRENAKKTTLSRGEVAIFINKSWTACKILTIAQTLIYHRVSSGVLSVETLKYLPTYFGGSRLVFTRNLEANLIKAFEAQGVKAKNFKVAAYA